MADEWHKTTLGDVCQEVRYGYTASATDLPTGTHFLRVTDIASGPLDWKNIPFCEIDEKSFERFRLDPGDIVIARMGTIGVSALVQDAVRAVAASYLIRHRIDESRADPRFVSHVLRSPMYWEFVRSHGSAGSVQPNINAQVLGGFGFSLPPLAEQRAIAHVLGTLDDKIELNRRMNETLEGMAQAMFKSWFVDFDPVRAKMEGRDTGLPPDIAALFPDRLVDSELGEIPAGWEVRALSDCIDVARGLSYKGSGLSSNGMPMHNLNSIYEGGGYKGDGIKYYNGDFQPRHITQPGDVIVANTEQGHDRLLIGFAAIVPKRFGDNGLFSHHIYRVRPKSSWALSPGFVCQLLNTQAIHDTVSGYATGTTVNMLPVDALRIPSVVVPPTQLVTAFSTIAATARTRQEQFIAESQTLVALRDVLLPRLVSGELRVGAGTMTA